MKINCYLSELGNFIICCFVNKFSINKKKIIRKYLFLKIIFVIEVKFFKLFFK